MPSKRPNAQRAATARREAQQRRSRMLRWAGAVLLVVVSIGVAIALAGGGADQADGPATGAELVAAGGEVFAGNCSTCHGDDLRGTFVGPPLLHEIYLPDHHPDSAIRSAVANGVTPHHWDFAGMPPIPLEDDEVEAVIAYIRAEQEAAGIGQGDEPGATSTSGP
jgi:mono/diheme cytochrome c family protein